MGEGGNRLASHPNAQAQTLLFEHQGDRKQNSPLINGSFFQRSLDLLDLMFAISMALLTNDYLRPCESGMSLVPKRRLESHELFQQLGEKPWYKKVALGVVALHPVIQLYSLVDHLSWRQLKSKRISSILESNSLSSPSGRLNLMNPPEPNFSHPISIIEYKLNDEPYLFFVSSFLT